MSDIRNVYRSIINGITLAAGWFVLNTATAQPSTFYNLYQMPGSGSTNFCINAPANCVLPAPGNGYLISSTTAEAYPATQDVCIIRTDSLGDTLWVRRIGGPIAEQGRMPCRATKTSWLVPFQGWTINGQQDHVGVIHIGDNGDTLWVRSFGVGMGAGEGGCVKPTADGNFILIGMSTYTTGSFTHLVKFDLNGNMIWGRSYRVAGQMQQLKHLYSWRIDEAPDHGFVFGGFSENSEEDCMLAKTDSAGNLLWLYRYALPGVSYERLNDFCFMPNGNILAVAFQNDLEGFAFCTSSAGQVLWAKQYDDSRMNSICPIGNNYLVTGMYMPPNVTCSHPLAFVIDSVGNVVWAQAYDLSSTRTALFQHATVESSTIAFTGISDLGAAMTPFAVILARADLSGNSCNSTSVPMPVTPITLNLDTPSIIPYTAYPVVQYNYTAGVLKGMTITPICSGITTGINEPASPVLNVYPVPNNGHFTIALPGNKPSVVTITDCLGKCVLRETITRSAELDISGEAEGVYFIRICEGDRLTGVSKMVLVK